MRIVKIITIYFLSFFAILTILHIGLLSFFNYVAIGYFVLYGFIFAMPLVMFVYFIFEYSSKGKSSAVSAQLKKKIRLLLVGNILLICIAVAVFRIIKARTNAKQVFEINSKFLRTPSERI